MGCSILPMIKGHWLRMLGNGRSLRDTVYCKTKYTLMLNTSHPCFRTSFVSMLFQSLIRVMASETGRVTVTNQLFHVGLKPFKDGFPPFAIPYTQLFPPIWTFDLQNFPREAHRTLIRSHHLSTYHYLLLDDEDYNALLRRHTCSCERRRSCPAHRRCQHRWRSKQQPQQWPPQSRYRYLL